MENKNPVVTIEMENGGIIKVELYPEYAPNTVNNFISLINKNFYDGIIFHRVIEGFMIQGGDPLGQGTGGPGYRIRGEFSHNGFEKNTLKHKRGVISMARSMMKDSAGSQFFLFPFQVHHVFHTHKLHHVKIRAAGLKGNASLVQEEVGVDIKVPVTQPG